VDTWYTDWAPAWLTSILRRITSDRLVPIMWSAGAGADVMKRIAAPMIGGIFTSFVLELVVYPAIYEIWKWYAELKRQLASASSSREVAA
jgi:Cu/Ag efflux pump CusA